VTSAQIQELLEQLPADQRQDAARRLLAARDGGWTIMGFWKSLNYYRVHQWDLVGLDPSGNFEFLPA
jgi:hypothetical protein